MSDLSMSAIEFVDIDIRAWVEKSKANPALYRSRQVTETVLATIGLNGKLSQSLVLKGGTLMALAFQSQRVTGDIDFTAMAEPDGFVETLILELNRDLQKVAVRLGYVDLVCRVQTVQKRPRAENFESQDFPALLIRIGHAARGTPEEVRLNNGQAIQVVDVEISFRDQVYQFQELQLKNAAAALKAFTVQELIAEKLRALLQQSVRNRYRRQDIYDIDYLISVSKFDKQELIDIVSILRLKSVGRIEVPNIDSLSHPEVKRRAAEDWETLKLEISGLPEFDECFERVNSFYRKLPW